MSLKFFLILFITLGVLGCQSQTTKDFAVRNTVDFYQSTGGLSFLLEEVPSWSNSVSEFNCFRDTNLRLLNLQKIKSEFNSSTRQTLNLQYYYNEELRKVRAKFTTPNQLISLRDLDLSFFKALESSKSSFDPIRVPDFKKIHLTVYEEWLREPNGLAKLIEFLKSPIQNEGVPVIISFCTSQLDLENKFQEYGAYAIGAEWVAPFHDDLSIKPGWSLFLSAFFKPHQNLILYKANRNHKTDYPKIILGKYDIK